MEDILVSFKASKHLNPFLTRKRVRFERQQGNAFLGMYGSSKPFFFYIGFKAQETREPTLSLYIERSLLGTRKDVKVPRELKRNYRFGESDKTHCWFHFEQRVDKKLNGDAEAMKQWFHRATKLVLAMGKSK